MSLTTVPTVIVTLIVFTIIGLTIDTSGTPDISSQLNAIDNAFNISPWLLIVPVLVIAMIMKKTPPLIALLLGSLLGGIAVIAQPDLLVTIAGASELNFQSAYKG